MKKITFGLVILLLVCHGVLAQEETNLYLFGVRDNTETVVKIERLTASDNLYRAIGSQLVKTIMKESWGPGYTAGSRLIVKPSTCYVRTQTRTEASVLKHKILRHLDSLAEAEEEAVKLQDQGMDILEVDCNSGARPPTFSPADLKQIGVYEGACGNDTRNSKLKFWVRERAKGIFQIHTKDMTQSINLRQHRKKPLSLKTQNDRINAGIGEICGDPKDYDTKTFYSAFKGKFFEYVNERRQLRIDACKEQNIEDPDECYTYFKNMVISTRG